MKLWNDWIALLLKITKQIKLLLMQILYKVTWSSECIHSKSESISYEVG